MVNKTFRSALGIVALASVACLAVAVQDALSLKRIYKKDSQQDYKIELKLDQGGMKLAINSNLQVKVVREVQGGYADAELVLADLKLLMDGNEMPGMNAANTLKTKLDSFGMPGEMPHENEQALYSLFGMTSYVPSGELKKGSEYSIKWATPDSKTKVEGTGKFVEVVELDGVKAVVLQSDVQISEENDDKPAQLKSTNYLALDGGQLLKSEGTLKMENGDATFKIEGAKK